MTTVAASADIGVTGLGVMGRNLARHGFAVAVHNRSPERTRSLLDQHGKEGTFVPSGSLAGLVASLKRPRAVIVMVQAGAATDAVIEELAGLLEPGGAPCAARLGPGGAGHFVKMVHNGIEYADMQLIGEAYDLLRHGLEVPARELAAVFRRWNGGDLESFLITADVLGQDDDETGKALVDVILDQAGQKGTGRWTVQAALDLGVPVVGIAEAVFARSLSGRAAQRAAARETFGTSVGYLGGSDPRGLTEDVRKALYASKVIAYAQGFDQIRAGADEFAALESVPFGVGVNAVGPGPIETGHAQLGHRRQRRGNGSLPRRRPGGRVGGPEEVAEAIRYITSPRAACPAGQTIFLDGGVTAA